MEVDNLLNLVHNSKMEITRSYGGWWRNQA